VIRWVVVCKEHLPGPREEKTIGLAGLRACPVCGKAIEQGYDSVTMTLREFLESELASGTGPGC